MAAALLGRDPRTLRRMLRDGELQAEGDIRKRVRLAAVEAVRGMPVTVEEFLRVDRERDRVRAAWRDINAKRGRHG